MTSGPGTATLKSRIRKFVVFGGAAAGAMRGDGGARRSPVPPAPRSPPAPASRMLRAVTSLPLMRTVSPRGGSAAVRRRFDADVEALTGREHPAVGRHDANPRLPPHAGSDSQTHCSQHTVENLMTLHHNLSQDSPQAPLRNSVSATSTLLRSACLMAGHVLSHRSSVFHE